MEYTKGLEIIRKNENRYIDFLKDICTFEGTARDKEDIDRMVDFIESYARSLGFEAERTAFEKCGDFLTVDFNPGAQKGSVMLAHMDTVHPKGRFGTPAVRIEGERMIGPGVIDCKGGIAVAFHVMEALRECGYKKHTRLILTSDEEVSNILGGEKEQQFFRDKVKGFEYALNCETTEDKEVVISRRGILRYEIEVTGKGGHAGINYFNRISPVVECAKKIIALEEKSRVGGITFSCNVVTAGTAINVIPDKAKFTVDVRVVTHAQIEEAEKIIDCITNTSFTKGTTAVAKCISTRPPMEKNAQTLEVFNKLDRISRALGFNELIPVESGGGSDSAYTQAAGVVSVCGLGPCGEFCHTDREYVKIKTIAERAMILTAFLCGEN